MAKRFKKQDSKVDLQDIIERKKSMLESGKLSDCEFSILTNSSSKIFKAHRLILAMASPVFEAMFYGHLLEPKGQPITVRDVEIHAFSALLMYIYTHETNFESCDEVCDIFYAAHKYLIPSLADLCIEYIRWNLQAKSACRTLSFLRLFDVEPELKKTCLDMIKDRTEETVMAESFEDITKDMLKEILLQDYLQITEINLWDGVLRWSKKRCSRDNLEVNPLNLRNIMEELLPLFRFLAMHPTEFTNGPAKSKILNQEECLPILMNLISPKSMEMPPKFSSNTDDRILYPFEDAYDQDHI